MVNDYLAELDRVTVGLEPTTRADLLQEVRQHIIDAQAAGEDVHEVLARLGRPAEIAPPPRRREARQHITAAQAAGEDVHEVLARLGSPAEIAQAAGLVIHPSRPR